MAAAAGALARDDGDWDEPFTEGNRICGVMPTMVQHKSTTPRSQTSSATSLIEDELMKDSLKSQALHSMLTENTGNAIVENVLFKGVVSGLVCFNAICMGVEQDYPDHAAVWSVIDHALAAAFLVEMIIKLIALGRSYFYDVWNLLDFVLAILALFDTWGMTLVGGEAAGLKQFTLLRLMRLIRLARLARLFKSFNRLVIIMKSIVDAIESTLWVACVLVCCTYMAAIVCVSVIGHEGKHLYPGYSDVMDVIDEQEVMQNFNPHLAFGSMASAMVTLFNLAIFAEWTEVVRPIWVKQPFMIVFFMGFSLFVGLGVMNVIIGMIVDSVIQNARALEKQLETAKKEEKFTILKELKRAVFLMDDNGDAGLDLEELDRFMSGKDPENMHLLSKLSLPYGCSAKEFFTMLDNDGSGELDHTEFLTSLYRLINTTPFQQSCLLQISLNDVKAMINQNAKTTNTRIDAMAAYLGMPPPQELPSPPQVAASDLAAPSEPGPSPCSANASTVDSHPVGIALSTICEEIGVSLQNKVREELGARLKDLLPLRKAEDLCKACRKGGDRVWEPVDDNVIHIENRTINRDKDSVASATLGDAGPDARQRAKDDQPWKQSWTTEPTDNQSQRPSLTQLEGKLPAHAKHVLPEAHSQSRKEQSHPFGLPSKLDGGADSQCRVVDVIDWSPHPVSKARWQHNFPNTFAQ